MSDDTLNDQHDEPETFETFDAFWAEIKAEEAAERGMPETEVIRGVTVKIPHGIPLRYMLKVDEVGKSSSIDDIKDTLTALFGEDILDAWVDAGMEEVEFQTVMVWGTAAGRGTPISFRQAYERVKEGLGKAETQDSAPTRGGSAGTGARSRRISAANTGSRRASSPR